MDQNKIRRENFSVEPLPNLTEIRPVIWAIKHDNRGALLHIMRFVNDSMQCPIS
jgi:hypothetical protein